MGYKKLLNESIEIENKLYNEDKKFKSILNKLDEEKDHEFLKFLWYKRKNNISLARLNKIYYTYSKFLINYKISEITEEDFNLIFLKIKKCKNSNSTIVMHLVITKQILKYYKLHKKIDLDQYKIKQEKKPIMNEDLLTEDEKHYIIEQISSLKHKVFFTILFDTGLRVGEVYSIDKSCFEKTKKGYIIQIKESKTTIRRVFTYSHNYYIEKLLKSNWEKWDFKYRTTYNIIKRFEKKLNKRLYHHLARHTKATNLSKKLTEQELKNYMGWTPDSKMLNNYVHLSNEEVINKLQNSIC